MSLLHHGLVLSNLPGHLNAVLRLSVLAGVCVCVCTREENNGAFEKIDAPQNHQWILAVQLTVENETVFKLMLTTLVSS